MTKEDFKIGDSVKYNNRKYYQKCRVIDIETGCNGGIVCLCQDSPVYKADSNQCHFVGLEEAISTFCPQDLRVIKKEIKTEVKGGLLYILDDDKISLIILNTIFLTINNLKENKSALNLVFENIEQLLIHNDCDNVFTLSRDNSHVYVKETLNSKQDLIIITEE